MNKIEFKFLFKYQKIALIFEEKRGLLVKRQKNWKIVLIFEEKKRPSSFKKVNINSIRLLKVQLISQVTTFFNSCCVIVVITVYFHDYDFHVNVSFSTEIKWV